LENALGYITRTRGALGRIDKELQPGEETRMDLEWVMTRLNEVLSRVKAWKKSAVRSGADMALSLVHIHCKNVDEEKLKGLWVMNQKNLKFEDFMETFAEAATRIADGIDLETFIEPASPRPDA
jgi:hypothetical protein